MGGEELFSQAEVMGLTGKSARDAQAEWLAGQGVPFRRDGVRLLVSREHVRQWLLGTNLRPSAGPRLDLVK
jgi:hypothetical protein